MIELKNARHELRRTIYDIETDLKTVREFAKSVRDLVEHGDGSYRDIYLKKDGKCIGIIHITYFDNAPVIRIASCVAEDDVLLSYTIKNATMREDIDFGRKYEIEVE